MALLQVQLERLMELTNEGIVLCGIALVLLVIGILYQCSVARSKRGGGGSSTAGGTIASPARRTIKELWIYPIKGAQGQKLNTSVVDTIGLKYDRWWVVVDIKTNVALCSTKAAQLLRLRPRVDFERQELVVDSIDSSLGTLRLPLRDDKVSGAAGAGAGAGGSEQARHQFICNRAHCHGFDEGDEAAAWITKALVYDDASRRAYGDSELRLMRADRAKLHYTHKDPKYSWASTTQQVGFAYNANFLVVTAASFADLKSHIPSVDCNLRCMRANVVLDGCKAWEEDSWDKVQLGDKAVLQYFKPCARCGVIMLEPTSGKQQHRSEPLAALKRYRCGKRAPGKGKGLFGVNFECQSVGAVLSIGDEATILESSPMREECRPPR